VDITVIDVPDNERFEARDADGNVIGFVTYQLTGNIIVYTHTEVAPEHEGMGIGSQLAKAVMDDAKSRSRNVVPICPYLTKWLQKHPEYDGVVVKNTRRVR
jgi:predicted GNAT family acetyltransferase